MSRYFPTLRFALWTYLWLWLLPTAYFLSSTAQIAPADAFGSVWDSLHRLWGLCLLLFPISSLASYLAPRWGKVLALLLLPLALLIVRVPVEGVVFVLFYLLPAALLASLPSLVRRIWPQLSRTYA